MVESRKSQGKNLYSTKMNHDAMNMLARGIEESPEDQKLKAVPFKVVMLGDVSVGKTCIFKRYFYDTFEIEANTLSACFESKNVVVNPDGTQRRKIKLQVWDTAGSEQYRSINSLYYKKAAVVLLVFSVTDIESLEALDYWVDELDRNGSDKTVRFLVAAKTDDVDETQVSKADQQAYAAKYNAHLFLTSSKENIGIDKLFVAAANTCALNMSLANETEVSRFAHSEY